MTLLYSVPSAYAALVAERGHGHEGCFASVRAAVSAGEGCRPGSAGRSTELLGAPVLEQIGSTEAGHAFCANGFDHNHPGTVGRPVPGFEVELRDRDGHPGRRTATEGELWVRGPTVTPGYLNRPEETARALVDGWLATRDRAVPRTGRHLPAPGPRRRHGDGRRHHRLPAGGGGACCASHPAVREVAVAAVARRAGREPGCGPSSSAGRVRRRDGLSRPS